MSTHYCVHDVSTIRLERVTLANLTVKVTRLIITDTADKQHVIVLFSPTETFPEIKIPTETLHV